MLECETVLHRDFDTVFGYATEQAQRYPDDEDGYTDEVLRHQATKRVALQFVEARRVSWDYRKLGPDFARRRPGAPDRAAGAGPERRRERRGRGPALVARRDPARHDLGARALARAGRLLQARRRPARLGRGGVLGGAAPGLRVLGARCLSAAALGVAVVRLQAARVGRRRGRAAWPPRADRRARRRVLARLERGPATIRALGSRSRGSSDWWSWSPAKVAIEELLREGVVTVTRRSGWRRVYDLAERAIPPGLLAREPDDEECVRALVADAGARLGVATAAELAEYHRLPVPAVERVVGDTRLAAVEVEGWGEPAWAHPEASDDAPQRTTLLSPFDSLLWHRGRVRRLFGFEHRIEAYVPRAKRVHGYFAMPLLARGAIRGRVDPARDGATLVARRVSVEPGALPDLAAALQEAAAWVGCDSVAVERIVPRRAAAPLRALLT